MQLELRPYDRYLKHRRQARKLRSLYRLAPMLFVGYRYAP